MRLSPLDVVGSILYIRGRSAGSVQCLGPGFLPVILPVFPLQFYVKHLSHPPTSFFWFGFGLGFGLVVWLV